jgi:hypothetical protein
MKMMKEKKIRKERQQQSRIAWKELYYMYKDDIHTVNLHRGQDNFFDILCLSELPEKRNRSCARTTNLYHPVHTKYELRTNMNKSSENKAITTNSYEQLHIHKILINDLKLERFNQMWVSDITCLRTGCRNALQKGISTCVNPEKIIYYSSDTETLISMTEENRCYEKGLAEQVNFQQAKRACEQDNMFTYNMQIYYMFTYNIQIYNIFCCCPASVTRCEQAIIMYNIRRPYWALKFNKTPEEVHSAAA